MSNKSIPKSHEKIFSQLRNEYHERRIQLDSKLSVSTDEYLNEKVKHSILMTDTNMELIIQEIPVIMNDFSNYQKKQTATFGKHFSELKDNLKEFRLLKKSVTMLGNEQLDFSKLAIENTKNTLKRLTEIQKIEVDSFIISINIILTSLILLYKSTNSKDLDDAFKALIKLLLGLTGITNLFDCTSQISEIKGAYYKNEYAANATLNFLNEYIYKCYSWQIASQTIIEHFKRLTSDDDQKISEDNMEKLVSSIIQNRIDAYINRKINHHP